MTACLGTWTSGLHACHTGCTPSIDFRLPKNILIRVGSHSLFDRLDGKNIPDDCLPTQNRVALPSSCSGQGCGSIAQPSRESFCPLLFPPSFLSIPSSPWYSPTKMSASVSLHQFLLLAVKMPVFYRGLKQKRTVWLSPFDLRESMSSPNPISLRQALQPHFCSKMAKLSH